MLKTKEDLYAKTFLAQLKSQLRLVKQAANLGKRRCLLIEKMLPLISDKFLDMGYNLVNSTLNGRCVEFIDIDESKEKIKNINQLIPEQIMLSHIGNDEKKLRQFELLFLTARSANAYAERRASLMAYVIAEKLFELINRGINEKADEGKEQATFCIIKSSLSTTLTMQEVPALYAEGITNTNKKLEPMISPHELKDSIEKSDEFFKVQASFNWEMYQDLSSEVETKLKEILKNNGVEAEFILDTANKYGYGHNRNVISIKWDDAEELIREAEKYQPGGIGYQETSARFSSYSMESNILGFIKYNFQQSMKSITPDELYQMYQTWTIQHDIQNIPSKEEFSESLNKRFPSLLSIPLEALPKCTCDKCKKREKKERKKREKQKQEQEQGKVTSLQST